ncbi:tetratricopeptide repeat protein (macronuclear) [Tetrahymena thermophila SB210]|uniref:Tetratricopeptide repeat protein n=1 Tax=Tetrahymena thermophila (strain SB210) TaxID=312017 RepID=Q237F9_TETTS|nr:tetratricopeptide repeat protein [Tetrahymena thermophila SB210]EAR92782.2 tetratricopeptide repeat protein [Tetrahymena thermophila SB210]|eukprot:XP_001013027.2 tetratricopeptide repeat protein [Tetrahymena thermophila SB210]
MKKLTIQLTLTVSLPIIVGVFSVLIMFYQNLWDALEAWEQDSEMWILQTQKQMLMNSIYSSKIIEGYSFTQVQIHMSVINKLLKKYQNNEITVNKQAYFTVCSYRELIFNQCPENVYSQLNQSQYYVDLYFVRQKFRYDLLTQEQQYFIQMNDFISFYGKSAFYASQLEGLIQLAFIYNNDKTSVQQGIPSGFYNYTDSEYESCLGKDFIEPYDPRCRKWYQFAAKNQGQFFFEPYLDSIGNDLLMTLSSQITRQNEFYSVNSIDIYMINLKNIFGQTQTNCSYSVLLHEFNSTVFAHPLLDKSNLTSWPDLEYNDLASNCQGQQKFQECTLEKQSFQYQISQTQDFIKTGNYSLEQNQNLDKLYQQWSKFGNKKISMIYPILSQVNESQLPYSYSIVLTARVFTDNRESLKLFNLLNANYIKIPIFVSFIALIVAIVVFIINFARFQVLQIWKPIGLLTTFLKKSLLQDQSCSRTLTTQFDRETLRSQPTHFRKSSEKRQTKLTSTQFVNQPDYIYTYFQKLDSNDSVILRSPLSIRSTNQPSQKEKQITESPLSQYRTFRLSQYSEQDEDMPIKEGQTESLQTIMTGKVSQFYQHKNKSMIQIGTLNQQQQEQEIIMLQKEESETKKILKGLKPMFLEMKVIKKTFQDLEFVINYSVQSSQISSTQDSLNALFHFAKAKELFLKLNNQTGLSRCYFNLGLIYLLKYEYSLSSEYFQSAIQINLNLIGEDYSTLTSYKLLQGLDQDSKDQLIIFAKRIFSFAYSQKCSAFQQIYIEQKEYYDDQLEMLIKNLHSFQIYANKKTKLDMEQQNVLSLLKESLNQYYQVEKIIENHYLDFSDIFKIFLYQEISEILIYLGQIQKELTNYFKKIQFLFVANNIFISNDQFNQTNSIFRKKKTIQISNYNVKAIICETFKSKHLFLLGMTEKVRKNWLQAIEYLTQSLEISTHYDHFQKMRTIQILAKLFQKYCLKQDFIDEEYLNTELRIPIDTTILLELDPTFRQCNFLQIINGFKKYNFLGKNDRIQIIVYNRQINQFMPYTIIQNNDHWKIILDSLSNLRKEFYIYEEITQSQIQLQQALNLCVATYIYEQKPLETTPKIKQNLIQNKNHKIQELDYTKNNQIYLNNLKRKKLLLLLSNGDIQSFKYISQQKELKNQSLIIYHIKDKLNYEYKEYQNKHLKYELLSSQNDLIAKLSKLRLNENIDSQSVNRLTKMISLQMQKKFPKILDSQINIIIICGQK